MKLVLLHFKLYLDDLEDLVELDRLDLSELKLDEEDLFDLTRFLSRA
jgi:hypothetical protein